MKINHISVSRSKTYKECGYKYKLKYHDEIPNPLGEQFYFTYGKIVHKIAEVYVRSGGDKSLGLVSRDVLKGKIEIEPGVVAPPLPPDYSRRLPLHLRSIESLTKKFGMGGILEHKFEYDLDPPHHKLVTGFIDRLVMKDGKAFIIDYKTTKKGKFRETKQSIKSDLQLRIYARVVWREFGIDPENIWCALCYLEDEETLPAKYTAESLLAAEKTLLDFYNTIHAQSPDEAYGRRGEHCDRCEYREMCPYYRLKKNSTWDGVVKKDAWKGFA